VTHAVCPLSGCGSVDFIAATPTVRVEITAKEAKIRKSGAMVRCSRCQSLVSATPAGMILIQRHEPPQAQRQPEQRERPDNVGIPGVPNDMAHFNRRATP
jgi:hypothetical protein